MGSFKDAFMKAGLVSAAKAALIQVEERCEAPVEPQYAEDQQVSADVAATDELVPPADLVAYSEHVLKWGAAGVELLGKTRLIDALSNGMDGTGRGRSWFDGIIEQTISRKPRSEAQVWRDRLPNLGGRKGVPTFEREAIEVMDALKSGAVDIYMAKQRWLTAEAAKLTPPTIEDGEDRYSYQSRLDSWAGGQIEAVLKAMGFDSYRIATAAVEAREQAALEKMTVLWNEACQRFEQTGNFLALQDAEKATRGTVLGKDGGRTSASAKYHAAAHAKWAWPCVEMGWIEPSDPSVPPTAEWLSEQRDQDFVLRCSREAYSQYGHGQDFRLVFRARLLEVSNLKPDANRVLVRGKVAIDHEGRVIPLSVWRSAANRDGYRRVELTEEQGEKLLSNQPSSNGWVTIRTVKDWNGEKFQATLYTSDAFKALQVARSVKSGCGGTDIRLWMENFGRHPDKGFGRFYFRVQPGGAHWDQMIVSVDDRLRDRIELLNQLPDPADAPFAEDVYYVPMRLSVKDKGGHAFWGEGNSRAICFKHSSEGTQCSRRYIGSTVAHRTSGSVTAWTISAHTNKHDAAMVVAVIGKGQQLHLDTGMAIGFDGEKMVEIPGGALQPGEEPKV